MTVMGQTRIADDLRVRELSMRHEKHHTRRDI
jgi:hypothetical protein